jgi:RNA polymerase sigma-70 factor (ECF subfamily)
VNRPLPTENGPLRRAGSGANGEAGQVVGRIAPARDDGRSDAVLLARLRDGQPGALDALLERYWAPLFAYALHRTGSSDLAADIAQDAFCRLWERRSTWKCAGSARGLLFRLARNTAVSGHRRARARARASSGFAELYLERPPSLHPVEGAELRDAIDDAIAALPARRREVFQLRMLDELSYEEIADIMGTSRQTVANQLSRALTTLRAALAHLID